MSVPALGVYDLAARFGDAPGLAAVSFTVAPGERLVIVGGSGAGKTTLLRAIAGLGPCDAGSVQINGHDVSHAPPERRDAVYLHQTPLLFPHLSVFENVAFPLRVRRTKGEAVERRVREALAAVRLDRFANRRPRTLSGGQRHRVALARAVVARPAVLLLDEPLTALDPSLREEVRGALLTLQETYRPALVVVTHDLEDAAMLGHRIGVLIGGRLAQVAPPAELFARPATLEVARLLGIPNMVPGQVRRDGQFESALGVVRLDRRTPDPGPAVAVFGPGAVRIVESSALLGRVIAVRHRVRETTAVAAVGDLTLEVRIDPDAVPTPGSVLPLAVHAASITVFPQTARPLLPPNRL